MTFQRSTSANQVGGVTVSSFAATIMDDLAASNVRTTLGLGTFAVENITATPALTMAGNITLGGNLIATTNPTSATNILTAQFTGDATNSPFRWMTESVANGGGNPRRNPTTAIGYNIHPSQVANDTNDHGFGMWIEGAFGVAGSEQVEWYLQGRAEDGTIVRPMSCTFECTNGTTGTHLLGDSIFLQLADESIALEIDGNGITKLARSSASEVGRVTNLTATGPATIDYYNDGGFVASFGAWGSGFTYSSSKLAGAAGIRTTGGDIIFAADHANSDIQFLTGGMNERLRISTGGLLQFAGTSSSEPAIKRSTTLLQARLADDSDYATYQGKLRVHANAAAETPTATHTLRIFDAAGTEYKVLCVAA